MRIFLGGPAENLREPPHPSLMRHVQELPVIKDVGQAVLASVRLRYLFSRPKVPSPSQKRQRKEAHDDDCKNGCQDPPSYFMLSDHRFSKARETRPRGQWGPFLSSMLKHKLSRNNAGA